MAIGSIQDAFALVIRDAVASVTTPEPSVPSDLLPRHLGGPNPNFHSTYNARQLYVLRILAMASGSFSLILSIVTIYWFVKMNKSYRHQ